MSETPNNRLTPEERYRRDVHFHSLVDMMAHFIAEAQYTPTELREAAILASIKHEELNTRTWFKRTSPP